MSFKLMIIREKFLQKELLGKFYEEKLKNSQNYQEKVSTTYGKILTPGSNRMFTENVRRTKGVNFGVGSASKKKRLGNTGATSDSVYLSDLNLRKLICPEAKQQTKPFYRLENFQNIYFGTSTHIHFA